MKVMRRAVRRWMRRQARYLTRAFLFATFGSPVAWYLSQRADLTRGMQRFVELFPFSGR